MILNPGVPHLAARRGIFRKKGDWSLWLAIALGVIIAGSGLFAPLIAPWDPEAVDLAQRLQGPGWAHWLGTDHLGRDLLSRLIHGAKATLGTVALCLGLILMLGIAVGGLAGLVGGRVDQVIMRCCDVLLTFPTIVFALFMIGVLGTGLLNVVIAIAMTHWAAYARIVRSIVLSLRSRDFILAAQAAGAGRLSIFLTHMLPAILSQLVVLATLDIGHMALHIAGLSFLGLGVLPPTAEWGVMISDARQYVWTQPMLLLWPGLAILLSVLACNRIGDALRDRLDPQMRGGHCH